jgi:gluconokinase
MIVIVMGVSGSGKTTIGERVAGMLDWPFYDADDFHPPSNIEKMSHGVPLTDADRGPWLDALRAQIETLLAENASAVLSCSALRRAYRVRLKQGDPRVRFVYLKGGFDLIRRRLHERENHFMPEQLLASQFDALEEPCDALTIDVSGDPEAIVRSIADAVRRWKVEEA